MRSVSQFLALFFAVTIIFIGEKAWADTDYRCLNLCVTQGGSASKCMPQCTYGAHSTQTIGTTGLLNIPAFGAAPSKPPDTTANGILSNHRLLANRQITDSQHIVDTTKPPNPYVQSKDYACIAQCTQAKLQYQTCENSCTTVTMRSDMSVISQPNNTATSGNALGILKAHAAPPPVNPNPYTQ